MAYKIKELAAEWRVSEKTLRRMIAAGKVQTFNAGSGKKGGLRISEEEKQRCERGKEVDGGKPTDRETLSSGEIAASTLPSSIM